MDNDQVCNNGNSFALAEKYPLVALSKKALDVNRAVLRALLK